MTTQDNGTTGLESNVAAMMCYILLPFSSIAFLIVEKQDKTVRFHAWQSAFLIAGTIVLVVALHILGALLGLLANFLGSAVEWLTKLVWIGFFITWIVCLVKSYQDERWKIPVIGDMAEKQMRQ